MCDNTGQTEIDHAACYVSVVWTLENTCYVLRLPTGMLLHRPDEEISMNIV